jgi:hypothetical protein
MAAQKKNAPGGKTSFVLMVGDEGAILVQMQKKRVVRRMFAQSPEPAHTRAFEDALAAAPRGSVTMIVDMMDQSYVRQTLPPVSSFSVGKIVRRRLDKDFSRDDIKGYIVLDREKTGRRDWNYLMVSLANPPLLQKWIAFAVERPNPFRGMGLAPLESQPFIGAIADTYLKNRGKDARALEWHILVSHNKVGGFRQVVLRNGKLVFTRMAQPIGESSPEVIAGNIEQEMINTQEYLKRMGLQDPATLSATIFASEDIKQVLEPKNIKAGEVHFFTPYEMATTLSLPDAAQPEDHFGDVVISAFIGSRRKLLLPLNTPYTSKLAKRSFYITCVRAATAAIALGIFGWMGFTGWDWYSTASETEAIVAQQAGLRAQLQAIKTEARKLPSEINTYTDVMTLARALNRRRYDALEFIDIVSHALDGAALVKSYQWKGPSPLTIGKDGDKRLMEAELEVQMTTPLQPHDAFAASAQAMFDRLKVAFPDFDVTHSELPGMLSDTKEMRESIDENGNTVSAGEGSVQSDTIKITIKGPQDKAENGQPWHPKTPR